MHKQNDFLINDPENLATEVYNWRVVETTKISFKWN